MSFRDSKPTLTLNPLFTSGFESFNHLFETMKIDLSKFHEERNTLIDDGTINANPNFPLKESIYLSLEQLLIDLIYITIPQKKNEKINLVYKWYRDKLTQYNSVAKLNCKTFKDNQLEFADSERDRQHNTLLNSINESNDNTYRSIDRIFPDPKKLLQEYKVKQLFKSKSSAKFNNSLIDFASTLGSTKAFTRYPYQFIRSKEMEKTLSLINNNKNTSVNNANSDTITNNTNTNSNVNIVNQSNKEQPPPDTYLSLKRQCDIITGKNKALSNKRHLEEVQSMLNEYGFIRSRFKEDQMKRLDMKKVLGSYSNSCPHNQNKKSNNRYENLLPENKDCYIKLDINENKLFVNKTKIKKGLNNKSHQKLKRINLKLSGSKYKQLIADMHLSQLTSNNISTVGMNANANDNHNGDDNQSDTVSQQMSINPIFKERFINNALLSVQKASLAKTAIMEYYDPISSYDLKNLQLQSTSVDKLTAFSISKRITSVECAKEKFNESASYLDIRKTMEKHKHYDFSLLNHKLQTKKRELNKSALLSTFLSPQDNSFLMGFLPKRGGQGLLLSSIKPK